MALRAALGILSIAFLGVVGYAVYQPPEHVVTAGEEAPPFSIAADSGRTVSLPGFGGKLLVLNFCHAWKRRHRSASSPRITPRGAWW